MSLTDPTKKMSKSDADPASRILITDSKVEIRKKINGARTDSIQGISYDREVRPGVSNLIDILSYMSTDAAMTPEAIAKEMAGADMSMKDLKARVADAVDEGLRDVRDRYQYVMGRPSSYLEACSAEGRDVAMTRSSEMMRKVKVATGLESPA